MHVNNKGYELLIILESSIKVKENIELFKTGILWKSNLQNKTMKLKILRILLTDRLYRVFFIEV